MDMITEGDSVPKFTINDSDGNKVKSTDFKGKSMSFTFIQKISHQDVQLKQMNFQQIIKNFKIRILKLLVLVQMM